MLCCETMNPTLEKLLRENSPQFSEGNPADFQQSSVTVEEGEKLQQLIIEKRPKVSLEVGLGFGISSLFICEAMEKVGGERHIVIDSERWDESVGLRHLEAAGYGHLIDFRAQESETALPRLVAEGTRVDFAFIDGCHAFDHALIDFFYIDKLLSVGGIVAFDDADQESVHGVCRFVATNRSYKVCATVGGSPDRRTIVKAARWAARRFSPLRRLVHNRVSEPDEGLGFSWASRLIAFEKTGEDKRRWDFHREF